MATNDSTTTFDYRFPVSRFTTGGYLDQFRANYNFDPPQYFITESEKEELSKIHCSLDCEFTTMILGIKSMDSVLATTDEKAGIGHGELQNFGWLLDHMGGQMLDHLNHVSKHLRYHARL